MVDPKILRLVAITDDAEDQRARIWSSVWPRRCAAARPAFRLASRRAAPREVVEITQVDYQRVSVPVIVNDRADIALAAGAAGVHVGEADLPVAAVRRFAPPAFIIGASLGGDAELRQREGRRLRRNRPGVQLGFEERRGRRR